MRFFHSTENHILFVQLVVLLILLSVSFFFSFFYSTSITRNSNSRISRFYSYVFVFIVRRKSGPITCFFYCYYVWRYHSLLSLPVSCVCCGFFWRCMCVKRRHEIIIIYIHMYAQAWIHIWIEKDSQLFDLEPKCVEANGSGKCNPSTKNVFYSLSQVLFIEFFAGQKNTAH